MPRDPVVGRLASHEVDALAALVSEIIADAAVYSERAREEERAKYTADALRERVIEDPDSVLVARVEGQLAGFVLSRYDDGLLWLSWLGVSPPLRGLGLARELLAAAERTAPARRCHALWCDSRTDNAASASLLTRAGFTRLAELRNHWYGQDFYLWRKSVG
jgi:ribosomal protein S18 acetylase RimI-like enzyme